MTSREWVGCRVVVCICPEFKMLLCLSIFHDPSNLLNGRRGREEEKRRGEKRERERDYSASVFEQ